MKNLTFDLPCRKSTNDIGQNWPTMVKRRVLKGLETFNTCFFQSVNNGLPNVSTSFLWSDPAGFGVIWRKLFCVFGCRPLKMCLQLLLWLEKDSSFDVVQNTMQGYCLPVGTT